MRVFAAFLLILVALTGCRFERGPAQQPAIDRQQDSERSGIGFASRRKLEEHYLKHGREFGSVDIDQYLRLAQVLRDGKAGGEILEIVRADGVITRFDRRSGAFLAFNPDYTIRTFFVPNDGEAYFRRQARRSQRMP